MALTIDGRRLLQDVSFTAKPGTLTAVIGPSGAGKSTLVKLIGGALPRSAGVVAFDGHDVHAEYASMRSRIGVVPQDDVVHRQLTVEQALSYAAELRLPPDTSIEDRRQVVERVLDELELAPHKKTRVDKLSGGQRKRASVAMELLTGPSLLILDEPTSGLDPALDRQVMTMLRRLADAGRVVIVVTHSLTYVSMCDQLLLLAPGGKTAFADPPSQIEAAMGSTDWADIFARVSTDPDGVHRAFLARHPAAPRRPSPTAGAAPLGKPPRTSRWRQVGTLARRQARLITADRGYFAFLALLPFVLGVLSLAVPGNTGLGNANSTAPEEPIDILILLNIGAVFMGTALTVRDLVGERMIFQRERAVGLSASAYLMAKVLVFSAAALIETAVMVAIMAIGKGAPSHGGVLLGRRRCGRRRRAVADPGIDGYRVGDAGAGAVVAGALHRAGAADAGGGHHDLDGDGRRFDTGDRAAAAGPDVMAGAGPLGFRRRSVDRGPEQHRGGAARRPVVAPRAQRVAARHGHAYRVGRRVHRRRPLPATAAGAQLGRCGRGGTAGSAEKVN